MQPLHAGARKILTPMVPIESVVKAQRKQMLLTPAQAEKVREVMRRNPSGGVTLTFDAATGQIKDIGPAR